MLLPLRKHQVDALLHVFGLHQQIISKMLVDDGADVVDMAEFKKETGQVLEFLVGLAVVERDDGDPVRQLQGKGVHRVVYQHHFFEASVQDSQVFHVDTLLCFEAVIAEESVGDVLALGVKQVYHFVRVAFVRGSEDDQLEVLRENLQDLFRVRTDENSGLVNHTLLRFFSHLEGR